MTPHLAPDFQIGTSLDQDLGNEGTSFLARAHERGITELQ